MKPQDVVLAFWQCMHSNDFLAASEWLSDDFECLWPQSGERIKSAWDYAMINIHYPSFGPWSFEIESLLGDGDRVVCDVRISDGIQEAKVISFSQVKDGKISHQTEYWPESFPTAEWRKAWTCIDAHDNELIPIERKHCVSTDMM